MNLENDGLLEYQSLKQILARFTDSPFGAQLLEQLAPISHRVEIQRQFKLTEECLQLLSEGHELRFLGLVDISPLCERLTRGYNLLSQRDCADFGVVDLLGVSQESAWGECQAALNFVRNWEGLARS